MNRPCHFMVAAHFNVTSTTEHFFDCLKNLSVADSDDVSQIDRFASQAWPDSTVQDLTGACLPHHLVTCWALCSNMPIKNNAVRTFDDVLLEMLNRIVVWFDK